MDPIRTQNMDETFIVQHNVLHWETRKFNLTNTYKEINPHIILLNSHGANSQQQIIIQNSSNQYNDGIAILVKDNIKHWIDDSYLTDIVEIIIQTDIGEISIGTTYLFPRRPYIAFPDFQRIATKNSSTYLIGDLSAALTVFDTTTATKWAKT